MKQKNEYLFDNKLSLDININKKLLNKRYTDDIKDKNVLVIDNGLFTDFAYRLTKYFNKVFYYTNWVNAFPVLNERIIGYGLDGVIRIDDIFKETDIYSLDIIDLFVFPDVGFGGLQKYLYNSNKNVWGALLGEEIELYRYAIKEKYSEVGLLLKDYKRVVGTKKLREELTNSKGIKIVKISKYRGVMETFIHKNIDMTNILIDKIEYQLGALKDIFEFIIEDYIEKDVEYGYDGYVVNGQYPKKSIYGYEDKGLSYIMTILNYEDIEEGVRNVNDKLKPILREYNYNGFFSTEIIRDKSGKDYLIDFTARNGSPPSELYTTMMTNLGDVIYYGSIGELIEPKYISNFGMQLKLHSEFALKNYYNIYFDNSIRDNIFLPYSCKINDKYYIVPQEFCNNYVGSIVVYGESVSECIRKVEKCLSKVDGIGLETNIERAKYFIEEILIKDKNFY